MSWRARLSVAVVALAPLKAFAQEAVGVAPAAPPPAGAVEAPAPAAAPAPEPAQPPPAPEEERQRQQDQQQQWQEQQQQQQVEQAAAQAVEGEDRPSSDEEAESKALDEENEKAQSKPGPTAKHKKKLPRPKAQRGRGVPLRVDVSGALLYRDDSRGTARAFGDEARGSLVVRGARLWRDDWWRLGVWLGYRFEPGSTRTLLEGSGSKGVQAWLMGHDLMAGPLIDFTVCKGCGVAGVARLSAGAGLTIDTLQMNSLDDGHIYSETTRTYNLTATLELGLLVMRSVEVVAGVSRLNTGEASLGFQQSDAELSTQPQSIGPVARSGWLPHLGVGLEF